MAEDEGDQRPVPDPTALTTDALRREIAGLRELLETRFDGQTRVGEERFHSIEQRFDQLEQQRREQKDDSKVAIDAALNAAKEAVREQTIASERAASKTEVSFAKQLEQQQSTFSAEITGLRREIGDVKERLTIGAGQDAGQTAARTVHDTSRTALIAVAALLVAVVVPIAVALILRTH